MKIGPGRIGLLFTGSPRWELSVDRHSIAYLQPGQAPVCVDLDTVNSLAARSGAVWAEIEIAAGDQVVRCDGILNRKAHRFVAELHSAVGHALIAFIESHKSEIAQLAADLLLLFKAPRYLANRDIDVWRSTVAANRRPLSLKVMEVIGNPLLPREETAEEIRSQIGFLFNVLWGARTEVGRRNERFVADELLRYRTFFDRVEKTPLTVEQRTASVVMEDRNLLVAAAGSGKTSTVVGKIGYALLTKQYAPTDFLVLAFNNDAAKELDERINEQLKSLLPKGERVKANTFHALGLEIIAIAEGKKPSISNFAASGGVADSLFVEKLIQECIRSDSDFAIDWVTFRAVCLKTAMDPAEFTSIEEWNEFVRANGDFENGKLGFLTLQGEVVKSQGELAIANWLYMRGVEYEYERPYEYETADQHYRQYHPDFYFPVIGAYLEHYAVDKNGRPPAAFGAKYAESMAWKASLHVEKATDLITTTFAEFVSGELFAKLEDELSRRGQQFSPRPIEDVLTRLNEFQKTDYGAFLRTCFKHAKSNELDEVTLQARVESNPQPLRARLFMRVLSKLILAYEDRLRAAGEIDFEDMIVRAAGEVASNRYTHSYKLILVDEFQDISQARAKLVKALLAQAPECKLFAVGDDWQSIYRFAGSDIDVFTNFARHFGVTATNYLTQTFRSNQGITDVAAGFIQKNASQMRKQVQAQDAKSSGVVVICRYGKLEMMAEECRTSLEEISQEVPRGKRASVFLLARYRHQRPKAFDEWHSHFRSLDIVFKTVHSSKGLQADYVIILGLHTGRYAFPSEISDDALLRLVMPEAETYPNAEERRLFYVAMTRARHRVYLLGGRYTPSPFLSELMNDDGIRDRLRYGQRDLGQTNSGDSINVRFVESCPKCGQGKLRNLNGKFGEFIGCSNFPSCRYTRAKSGKPD
jgi:DNA helicase-4